MAAAGLVKMSHCAAGNISADAIHDRLDVGGAVMHHLDDRTGRQGNLKDISKQFMDAVGADSANGIERHNERTQFLPILHRRVYARGERPAKMLLFYQK